MKIQLFIPPQGYVAQRWEEGSSMPPLGVLFLAAVLEEKGFETQVVPADILGLTWEQIGQKIRDFKPDLVGATTTTENRFDAFRLVREAKRIDPSIRTVLGGPHISMAREDTLRWLPEVDFLVIGEGENTLLELCAALSADRPVDQVRGLCLRQGDQVIYTGDRPPIADLDNLPFPARHLLPMERYRFQVQTREGKLLPAQNLMTSRGCPFNCYFCATPVNWGRRMRGHSPERVIREIEHVIDKYGAEFIWFYDDTLNYNPARLETIMDLIIERKLNIKFCNEFRIDAIGRPLLEKMLRAGLDLGFFGVEAGSDRVRREVVGKNFDIEKAFQFVRWAKELNFTPSAFFIFSHYSETWPEAKETIAIMDKLREINPETQITTAILHVYPGTHLEKLARHEHIIPPDFSWAREKDMKRVHVLPAAQGHVPLFKHLLTWPQIADLVMRWSATRKKIISPSKIRQALRSLTSAKDVWIYLTFFLIMLKYKLKKIWKNPFHSSD